MQHHGVKYLKVGDIRVLVRWGKGGQVALEVKKKSSIVDLWNTSPADQDGAAIKEHKNKKKRR